MSQKEFEMSSRKILSRLVCSSMVLFGIALITGSGCAFGDRHLTLAPVQVNKVPGVTAAKSQIQVNLPVDKRTGEKTNIVGYVRNAYGIRTADVIADNNVSEWVQKCIEDNLRNSGFDVSSGEANPQGLCVETSIRTLECDCRLALNATVILDIELRKNKVAFFNQSFVGKASKSSWAASAEDYQAVLMDAMQDCLNKAIPVVINELKVK